MLQRLDFWVMTISLLVTAYALGRAVLMSWGSREPADFGELSPATRSPARPATIGSMQQQRRRIRAAATRNASTRSTKKAEEQHTGHTIHTSGMDSMGQQEAVDRGMSTLQPSQPPIPQNDDTIPPYEPPPQPGPAGDRDAAIRALVNMGWKANQIADNLKGDRNNILKRIREMKAAG